MVRLAIAAAIALLTAAAAAAGEADVIAVEVTRSAAGLRFSVTVRHDDEGWDHFADRWEVLGPAGEVLALRVLAHPHENEQPFTRTLAGVEIAPGLRAVRVRAHDSVHGDGGAEIEVELPR